MSSHKKESAMGKKLSLDAAKEQAAQYFGFAASEIIEIDGEDYEIPFPQLMSEEQRQAIDQMNMDFEDCDREPPTRQPDVKLADGSTIKGGQEIPGPYKEPYRKDGALMDPSRPVRLLQALWGEAKAQKFIDAGGPPGIVDMIWSKMNDQHRKRAKADPK